VIHVEAGLRSFDRAMPEETNRLVTDVLSDFLFVSEESGIRNLRAEGVAPEKVFLVGNVMIDTLHRFYPKAEASTILEQLGVQAGQYAVVTLHRPSNVDLPEQLAALIAMLERIAQKVPVILPIHPRTRARLGDYQPSAALSLVPPLGYLDFMQLTSKARLVLTDSGGIQEETTVLGIPCFTLRDNTERPSTVEVGSNYLVGADPEEALRQVLEALETGPKTGRVPDFWDGRAAERIFDVLELRLGEGA
jgi:UDP-N-acetylglucosamine 2-epimerase (non-hydrolysing)